jgi:putative transport protein
MNWIIDLLWGNGVAHTVLLLSFVIAIGIALGKVKIAGVSLGMTMVLFVGIALAHFGFKMNVEVLHFVRDFGLILFVYAVGLQVGPGFISSFKKGGIQLNILATLNVTLGVIITLFIHFASQIPISTMVGILSGAVTNTPGLGAAQEAFNTIHKGYNNPSIALGYAVAYPLGVLGIIFSIIFLRVVFRVSHKKELEQIESQNSQKLDAASAITVEVKNPALFGKTIQWIMTLVEKKFVISRVMFSNGNIDIASSETILNEGDKVFVITTPQEMETIIAFIGLKLEMTMDDWNKQPGQDLISRRILVTHADINGKSLQQINLRNKFGVNVTRVNRSGIDLVATPELTLQMGDRVTVVGTKSAIAGAEKILGNELKRLNEPNLIPIFIGILLGIVLGSIPVAFPGIPQPVKLGLAGGPLIVAILMSIFGNKFKLVTYTTMSANLIVREIGICLFLACVGINAGANFVETLVSGPGLSWMGLGVIITVVPLLIVGFVGRYFMKINYFTLMGMMAGSMTDPPALSYSVSAAGNDHPSVGYATVYPLTMFLRVLTAQLLILFFAH